MFLRSEHNLIRRALDKTGGNKGQASKLLNLKRTTLVEKLQAAGAARWYVVSGPKSAS